MWLNHSRVECSPHSFIFSKQWFDIRVGWPKVFACSKFNSRYLCGSNAAQVFRVCVSFISRPHHFLVDTVLGQSLWQRQWREEHKKFKSLILFTTKGMGRFGSIEWRKYEKEGGLRKGFKRTRVCGCVHVCVLLCVCSFVLLITRLYHLTSDFLFVWNHKL